MALQESTYDRAPEGLTTTGHFHNDGTGTKMQKALKIDTLNCKGANHISAREKNRSYDENAQAGRPISTRDTHQHKH